MGSHPVPGLPAVGSWETAGSSGTPATRQSARKLTVLANEKDEQKCLLLHKGLSSAPAP